MQVVEPRTPVPGSLDSLNRLSESFEDLLANPTHWARGCEMAFRALRPLVLHVRKSSDALAAVERKPVIQKFTCKYCVERPVYAAQCAEVFQILGEPSILEVPAELFDHLSPEFARCADLLRSGCRGNRRGTSDKDSPQTASVQTHSQCLEEHAVSTVSTTSELLTVLRSNMLVLTELARTSLDRFGSSAGDLDREFLELFAPWAAAASVPGGKRNRICCMR